jgi:hypothetical protein
MLFMQELTKEGQGSSDGRNKLFRIIGRCKNENLHQIALRANAAMSSS